VKKLTWHTEQRRAGDLTRWEKNPRKMSEKDKADLHESFSRFDYVEIVIINTDNRLIGGHQRHAEMEATGRLDEVIDVRVPNRKLTEKEFSELAIRLNKNRGQWDEDLLGSYFDMEDLKGWGFEEEELGKIYDGLVEVADDEFDFDAELEKVTVPVTQNGDVYLLGDHKLLCGDCRLPENWIILMAGTLANLQLTDPPYNVDYTGGTADKLKIANDKMSDADFLQFLTDSFTASNEALSKGAASYIFHSDSEGINFRKAFTDAGNKLAQCLIWVKNSIVMGRQDYQWQHEPILYGWKKGGPHKWYSDRKQSTVLNFDRPFRSEDHPTMKPIELVGYLMQNSSRINQIVIDGFVGSGTTIVTAEQLKRICYAMEMDPRCCDVIVKRWELLTGKKAKRIPYHGIKETKGAGQKSRSKKESTRKKESSEAKAC
jgi:DNA modification methylase